MVNVGPPRSRYQDRTDEQEIYGRKMSEKDKGEGAGVGRQRACPPQWGSASCDGRAGRKMEMVDCGGRKSHCRDRPFQEPYVGQKQPAPPHSVVGWELPGSACPQHHLTLVDAKVMAVRGCPCREIWVAHFHDCHDCCTQHGQNHTGGRHMTAGWGTLT